MIVGVKHVQSNGDIQVHHFTCKDSRSNGLPWGGWTPHQIAANLAKTMILISICDLHHQYSIRLKSTVSCSSLTAEYAYTLRVDEKSDVYSFGVVLLELITGHRPVGEFGEGVDIVQWAKRLTKGDKEQVIKIIDPRMQSAVPLEEAKHVFFIAISCIQEKSVERPKMREVVQMLSEFPRHTPNHLSFPSTPQHHQPKNSD